MTSHIGLHRFALFTSVSTFLLIIAGGLVTSTDSGLAVPDWPLSYGQLMPPMVGGIFYEHGHRMIATFVGLLTTVLAVWLARKEERKWVVVLGFIALLAVIVQGILGGMTVLYLLPVWISTTHATLAQSFFCLTVILAIVTSPSWKQQERVDHGDTSRTRMLTVLAAAAILVQLILGGIMRHSGSGMAIPDFPLSYTHWLPPTNTDDLASVNEYRLIYYDLPPIELGQIWIHFAHRAWALVVMVVVIANVVHVLRNYKLPLMREPAIIQGLLVLVQFLLGALTVWTGKGVHISTAHVAVGALLLGTSVALAFYSYGLLRGKEKVVQPAYSPSGLRTSREASIA
ncbi:MAG: heme A synthase [Bacteroidetes bacterium]|nr:heme A synthase [Bacteroidota bacterium]MCW5896970.1 heme A synthase [Bacteroidota bacterium]